MAIDLQELAHRGRISVEADQGYDPDDVVAGQDVITNILHFVALAGGDIDHVIHAALRNYYEERHEAEVEPQ